MEGSQKAVFLDKDGTLIRNVPYNVKPSLIMFEQGVLPGLRRLKERGYKLIVVSNQSGAARGFFSESALDGVVKTMQGQATIHGFRFDDFYFCPHHPCGNVDNLTTECECRKPKPGMLLQAALDHAIDVSQSWMIGDILNDVEAGNRAGCRSILINNGNETEWIAGEWRTPDHTVQSFSEATDILLSFDYHPGYDYQH